MTTYVFARLSVFMHVCEGGDHTSSDKSALFPACIARLHAQICVCLVCRPIQGDRVGFLLRAPGAPLTALGVR